MTQTEIIDRIKQLKKEKNAIIWRTTILVLKYKTSQTIWVTL